MRQLYVWRISILDRAYKQKTRHSERRAGLKNRESVFATWWAVFLRQYYGSTPIIGQCAPMIRLFGQLARLPWGGVCHRLQLPESHQLNFAASR